MNIIAQTRPAAPMSQGVNFRAQSQAPASRADLPKANVWLNIGYTVEGAMNDKGEPDDGFISLLTGVALDTMADIPITRGGVQFMKKQSSRNNLKQQLLALAATFKPGETRIIACDPSSGLSIQMRRVGDALPVIEDSGNEFAAELVFGVAE